MGTREDIAAAQKEEAKQAKISARHDKLAAIAEHEAAQAAKGEDRAKQPDDFSML